MRVFSLLAGLVGSAGAMELTPDNFDDAVAGKSVFIKFQAPWCGHCKNMKPAWDKLMGAYKGNPTALVADVDCTAAGQPICQKFEVRGYPTIKWGDVDELKDYRGGRDFDALKKFADESLGPQCGPANLDLCDAEKKAQFEEFMGMSQDKLEAKIAKTIKAFNEDVPAMKKVVGHLKKQGKKNDEL